jgi:hypothetical protein
MDPFHFEVEKFKKGYKNNQPPYIVKKGYKGLLYKLKKIFKRPN